LSILTLASFGLAVFIGFCSYRIVVKTAPVVGTPATVWDSGKVASNRTLNIAYSSGTALVSDTDYSWEVWWWSDLDGLPSETTISTFSTALSLATVDSFGGATAATASAIGGATRPHARVSSSVGPGWHGAEWISSPSNGSLNTYRAKFAAASLSGGAASTTIARGRLYVAGLGYAKTWLNGNLTDNHELGAFVTFEERVLYDCIEVTHLLAAGDNVIGLMVGDGWWSGLGVGPPQFALLLSITDSNGRTQYLTSNLAGSSLPAADDPAAVALHFTATVGPVRLGVPTNEGEDYDGRVAASLAGWNTVAGYDRTHPYTAADAIVVSTTAHTRGPEGPQVSQPTLARARAPTPERTAAVALTPIPTWVAAVAPTISPATLGSSVSAHTVLITTDADYAAQTVSEPVPG
jgi:hypothetical protein